MLLLSLPCRGFGHLGKHRLKAPLDERRLQPHVSVDPTAGRLVGG
jgi:hypothetical protein